MKKINYYLMDFLFDYDEIFYGYVYRINNLSEMEYNVP